MKLTIGVMGSGGETEREVGEPIAGEAIVSATRS
jgi:hypothetical protein